MSSAHNPQAHLPCRTLSIASNSTKIFDNLQFSARLYWDSWKEAHASKLEVGWAVWDGHSGPADSHSQCGRRRRQHDRCGRLSGGGIPTRSVAADLRSGSALGVKNSWD